MTRKGSNSHSKHKLRDSKRFKLARMLLAGGGCDHRPGGGGHAQLLSPNLPLVALPFSPMPDRLPLAALADLFEPSPEHKKTKFANKDTLTEEQKREQRMARNRKAAATSRQRKKEQLIKLQDRVLQLEKENEMLRQFSRASPTAEEMQRLEMENRELRKRILSGN